MTFIQLFMVVPALLFVAVLVRDFLSGLAEERIWSDPAKDDFDGLAF
jgi:hypothetical protein